MGIKKATKISLIHTVKRSIEKNFLGRNFWHNYFKVYDFLNEAYSYQILKQRVISAADIQPGNKVLDAGCGTGNFGEEVLKKEASYYGVDIMKDALEIARKKPVFAGREMLSCGDITKGLNYPDTFFDRIICNNVLYTLSDKGRSKALSELKRVLKPGGFLVLTVPKKGYRPYKIYIETLRIGTKRLGRIKAYWKAAKMFFPTAKVLFYNMLLNMKAEKGSFHYFDREELREEILRGGFKNIKIFSVYAGETLMAKATVF